MANKEAQVNDPGRSGRHYAGRYGRAYAGRSGRGDAGRSVHVGISLAALLHGTDHLGCEEGEEAQARLPPSGGFNTPFGAAEEACPEVADPEAKEEQVVSGGHDGPRRCLWGRGVSGVCHGAYAPAGDWGGADVRRGGKGGGGGGVDGS